MPSTEARATSDLRWIAAVFLGALACATGWSLWMGGTADSLALLPCPFLAATNVPCPGCGITRASMHFVRAEFARAWAYHPAVFVLVPLALGLAIAPVATSNLWGRVPRAMRKGFVAVALAAVLGRWVLRLVMIA